jgi:aspartate aminotransferase
MTINLNDWFENSGDLPERTPSELAKGLEGSAILKIAGEVRQLLAEGREIANFTVGDFSPDQFRIPEVLKDRIQAALNDGQTNYPPAIGIPEIRAEVRELYRRELGLDYPEGCVQVGSGARPPIFSAFACLVSPGETVLYQVPSWNIRYYVHLNQAKGVALTAKAENGFMLTAADLLPHLGEARMLVINTPQNPSGTVIGKQALTDICEAIVAENNKRATTGKPPLMLMYDQVYWQLTFGESEHHHPVGVVPEMAPYTLYVDAISKSWAATGLRMGWAVVPPWVRDKMKAYVGHMGAWPSRTVQLATAQVLNDAAIKTYMTEFKAALQARLDRLYNGFAAMEADGLPVHAIAPQGAIYLTVQFNDGQSDDATRSALLHEADTAVVPFTAFGYPAGSGWVRYSVGAVGLDDIDASLRKTRAWLEKQ